jgi:arsenite-transporting ATPase
VTALDRLLDALPPWILVCGKGGVGKTTCAAALARRAAARAPAGARALLISTDPAGTLGDAIGHPLAGEPAPVRDGLWAMQLDAARERDAFLARWRDVMVAIVDRGTYLERAEIEGLVDAALPGADETMAALRLMELARDAAWARVVVDTAPTGHTLRLLELPRAFRGALALLDAMQDKHRFMVRALTHRYRADEADAFLRETASRVEALLATLRDPARAAALLVMRPEPVVLAESARYAEALRGIGVRVASVVINAAPREGVPAEALAAARAIAAGATVAAVPLLDAPPIGLDAAAAWGAALVLAGDDRPRSATNGSAARGSPDASSAAGGGRRQGGDAAAGTGGAVGRADPGEAVAERLLAPRLTIVAGKGGVGKTTAACALGIAAAAVDPPALLVSTDPAPSIADALDAPVGDEAAPVAGVPGLDARQMDAAAAFARFRDAWGARVDALFDELTGGTLDAAADRRIMRDLLALAPPGIDELYALASLGETLAGDAYRRVVVDPAPTGHLLRLLEMPALALDWTHRLLRLMLRYREAVGLGDAAEELLAFARRTRALAALLADAARSGAVLVALDEPLVRGESARLATALAARDIALRGVLWNRVAAEAPAPLPVSPPVPHFVAPAVEPPPRGARAIRDWSRRWEAGTAA